MSGLGPYYLPIPPRAWYRVQDQCTYFNGTPPITVQAPLLGNTIPFSSLAYQTALINKGNILQYKKNSSNLTKQQRYAQIAKGKWTNRTTTWATQSDKYTNPNTNHLKRVGANRITLNGATTNLPVTCPLPPLPDNNILPPISNVPINPNPLYIPPLPNKNLNETIIPVVPVNVPETPEVILDLGNLICNTTENICTGEIESHPANRFFNPTSDSDVPGPIQELYWNDRIQTWYPKQRLTMNNSTDKWPYNAKLIFPIDGCNPPKPTPTPPVIICVIPGPPTLVSAIAGDTSVTLSWLPPLIGNECPITEYIID